MASVLKTDIVEGSGQTEAASFSLAGKEEKGRQIDMAGSSEADVVEGKRIIDLDFNSQSRANNKGRKRKIDTNSNSKSSKVGGKRKADLGSFKGKKPKAKIKDTEWTLDKFVFKRIHQAVPNLQVDLFASSLNHQLPEYVSQTEDPQAWKTNALKFEWTDLIAYAFPPTFLVPEVLKRITKSSCKMYLVAPFWPGKFWFMTLLNLLIDFPLAIPPNRKLLKQPETCIYHQDPKTLNLHLWPLSCNESVRQDFLKRLWDWQQLQILDHRYDSPTLTVTDSVIGEINQINVPSLRLCSIKLNFQ